MKLQAKTILLFLIYLFSIFIFCFWYTRIAMLNVGSHWMDLWPMMRYMLISALFNVLFFGTLKVAVKFSIDLFSHLTTRTITLGLIFYIIWGLTITASFDEYYLYTTVVGAMTLFVLVKEKLLFAKANDHVPTS